MRDGMLCLVGAGASVALLFAGAAIVDLAKPLGVKDCKPRLPQYTSYSANSRIEERVQGAALGEELLQRLARSGSM